VHARAVDAGERCDLCGGSLPRRSVGSGLCLGVCSVCRLGRLVDAPDTDAVYARYRTLDYFQFWGDGDWAETQRCKRTSARWLLARLERLAPQRGRLLEVGCAGGDLLVEARARGWTVRGIELCAPMAERANVALGETLVTAGALDDLATEAAQFDGVVFNDVLEHMPDLRRALATTTALLAPGGLVLVNTPDLASLSARLLGGAWPHYKPEHLHYLSRTSLRRYFSEAGLRTEVVAPAWKALSPAYLTEHFRVYSAVPGVRALHSLVARLPSSIRNASLPLLSGNLLAIARKPYDD